MARQAAPGGRCVHAAWGSCWRLSENGATELGGGAADDGDARNTAQSPSSTGRAAETVRELALLPRALADLATPAEPETGPPEVRLGCAAREVEKAKPLAAAASARDEAVPQAKPPALLSNEASPYPGTPREAKLTGPLVRDSAAVASGGAASNSSAATGTGPECCTRDTRISWPSAPPSVPWPARSCPEDGAKSAPKPARPSVRPGSLVGSRD